MVNTRDVYMYIYKHSWSNDIINDNSLEIANIRFVRKKHISCSNLLRSTYDGKGLLIMDTELIWFHYKKK